MCLIYANIYIQKKQEENHISCLKIFSQMPTTHSFEGSTPKTVEDISTKRRSPKAMTRCTNYMCHLLHYSITTHAPLAGCDKLLMRIDVSHWILQFTRPLWGATTHFWVYRRKSPLQLTHPVQGVTIQKRESISSTRLQFPHSAGVRLIYYYQTPNVIQITIHALLQSATH